jgi:hypothetical protein
MQATTCLHDGVPTAVLQEAACIFHDSLAVYSTNGMFDPDANRGEPTIGRLFRRSEFASTWGFLRLADRDAR